MLWAPFRIRFPMLLVVLALSLVIGTREFGWWYAPATVGSAVAVSGLSWLAVWLSNRK